MYQTRASYRLGLQAMRGDWSAAEEGLRRIVGGGEDPGLLARHALPTLARLAVRQGHADSGAPCAPLPSTPNAPRTSRCCCRSRWPRSSGRG